MKIRTNDTVLVRGGKDRGKRGKVQRVLPKEQRLFVEGVNFVKRHTRPSPQMRQAGVVQKEAPLHISRVTLVCPHCDQGVRVGFSFLDLSGKMTKVRVCNKCHEVIDRTN